jgi:hypothetical protein
LEAQRLPKDRIPEIDGGPVYGRTMCDLGDVEILTHAFHYTSRTRTQSLVFVPLSPGVRNVFKSSLYNPERDAKVPQTLASTRIGPEFHLPPALASFDP